MVGREIRGVRITNSPPHERPESSIEDILQKDVRRVLLRNGAHLEHREPRLHLQTDRLGRGIRSKLKEAMVLGD